MCMSEDRDVASILESRGRWSWSFGLTFKTGRFQTGCWREFSGRVLQGCRLRLCHPSRGGKMDLRMRFVNTRKLPEPHIGCQQSCFLFPIFTNGVSQIRNKSNWNKAWIPHSPYLNSSTSVQTPLLLTPFFEPPVHSYSACISLKKKLWFANVPRTLLFLSTLCKSCGSNLTFHLSLLRPPLALSAGLLQSWQTLHVPIIPVIRKERIFIEDSRPG